MRLILFCLMIIPLSATAYADTPETLLHTLSKTVRAAQAQSVAVDKELERLQSDEKILTDRLTTHRYKAVKAHHALQAMKKSPEKHIFLLPNSRYQERFYALRRMETLKNILLHRIQSQTQAILVLREKQAAIEDYKRRRDMLALTMESALQQIRDFNLNKKQPAGFQILIQDIKEEAESLDIFLKRLLNLPAVEQLGDQPLVFTLPVSGIVKQAENGIYIEAASQALVTAPARGQVVYAGAFKPLGNIIIINHGQGYISVLKNLGEIYVEEGFTIENNYPLGILPVDKADKFSNNSMLYYELRYNHTILNPIEKITGL